MFRSSFLQLSLLLSENEQIQLTKTVFTYVILSLRYAEYTGGPDAAFVFVSLH